MSIDAPLARGLLRDMVRIRRFEEKSAELYSAGKIRGFLHLYIGEEAIATPSQWRTMPSATEHEPQHIFAGGQQRRDIVGLIQHPLVEVCEAGRQQCLRINALSIQPCLVCA